MCSTDKQNEQKNNVTIFQGLIVTVTFYTRELHQMQMPADFGIGLCVCVCVCVGQSSKLD